MEQIGIVSFGVGCALATAPGKKIGQEICEKCGFMMSYASNFDQTFVMDH